MEEAGTRSDSCTIRVGLVGAGSRFCQKHLLPHLLKLHKAARKQQSSPTKLNIALTSIWSIRKPSTQRCLKHLEKLGITSVQAYSCAMPPAEMLDACDVVIATTPASVVPSLIQHIQRISPRTHIISTTPSCSTTEQLNALIQQVSQHTRSSCTILSPAVSRPTFKAFAAQHSHCALSSGGGASFQLKIEAGVLREGGLQAAQQLGHYIRLLRALFGECTLLEPPTVGAAAEDCADPLGLAVVAHFGSTVRGLITYSAHAREPRHRPEVSLGITYAGGAPSIAYDMSGPDFSSLGAGSALTLCLAALSTCTLQSKVVSCEEGLRDCAFVAAILRSVATGQAGAPQQVAYTQHVQPTELFSYTRTSALVSTHIARCACTADVVAAVRSASQQDLPISIVGLNNSSAAAAPLKHADADGMRLETSCMDRILWVTDSLTVTVQPSVTLRALTSSLATLGLCLPSLPVLLDQTVAGGSANGTHGSSFHHGTISDCISELSLVHRSSGAVVALTKGTELLKAARCGLGRMGGVVVQLVLEVCPVVQVVRTEVEVEVGGSMEDTLTRLGHASEHLWVQWRLGAGHAVAVCLVRDRESGTVYNGRNWFPNSPQLEEYMQHGERTAEKLTSGRATKNYTAQYSFPISTFGALLTTMQSSAMLAEYSDRVVELKFLRGSELTMFAPNSGVHPLYVCLNVWWECVDCTELIVLETALQSLEGAAVHFGKWHDWSSPFIESTLVADRLEASNQELDQEVLRQCDSVEAV